MGDSTPERGWFRAVTLRAGLVGLALGVVVLSGGQLVLAATAGGLADATAVVATSLAAWGIGLWAGAPDARREELRLRERWFAAAALLAVAGSFAAFWAVYQMLLSATWLRIGGLFLVVAVPIYALGLVIPILLAWADRWLDSLEEEPAGWAGMGPLTLGLVGGATLGVLLSGLLAVPRVGTGATLMATALLLVVPLFFPEPTPPVARETLVDEEVSPFGRLRVTEVAFPGERQPERRLYLNDEEESGELVRSGAPTLGYIAAAENWLGAVTPHGASYLFLGGGAYTLPRRITERDPEATVAVVERDPEVTRLAYRYFAVRRHHGITSVHGDARAFIEQPDRNRYDRIYVDVYGGAESLPYSLVTREAAGALARRLRPDGLIALNLIGIASGPESRQLWSVVRTYADVFPAIALYDHLGPDFPDRQNFLLAASLAADHAFPSAAGHFPRWPREEWPDWDETVVFRDLFPHSRAERTAQVEAAG